MITIDKIDNTFLQINCSDELAFEIRDVFSCYSKNYKYHPKFKARIWNGKVSFFDVYTRTLPIGLLEDLINYFVENNYTYKFNFDVSELFDESFTNEILDEFIKSINIPEDKTPRYYQIDAIQQSLYRKRGVLELGTGGGKSALIYIIIRYLLEKYNFKCLLVVPSIALVNQMYSDFVEYGWKNSEEFVDKLYSGQKLSNKPILISTWQSLMNKGRDFLGEFDAVLIDECHSLSDDSMKINNKTKERAITVVKNILIKCEKSSYKFGFTGTVPDEECDYLTLFGYIGPKIFEKKTKELMDENFLSQISIANLIFKYPEKYAKEYKDKSFQEEEKFVETYQPRMKLFNFILNSYETPQNTLILCRHIDHLKAIEKYLCDNLDDKFKVSLIYGEVKPEQREYLRKLMNQEDNMILLATYGTMRQGVNIPKIHNVIFASSYKAKITVIQSIGRGVRKCEEKDKLILWDLVDDLKYTTKFGNVKNNYIYEHWLMRLKYYKEQGFEYNNLKLSLKDLDNESK